ncbi:hypothetical protein GWK47_003841 [Chionoecetes opilio]|uniref:Uncharacterized protein n=1 Tax=Chionoecetes opilio TaxID=41210 RepID=A0A8J4YPS4_CHIOP|nr:hypothetical protein GWK47_003841 [Chionoecetes opilio]
MSRWPDPDGGSFWDMARIPMIRKDNIVTKIEKLHRSTSSSKKVAIGDRRLKSGKKRILRYFSTTSSRGTRECADHDDQPGDKEFPLAQREPGRRGRMGGVDSVLAAQETRQSLRLGKRPLLSPPANKKRRARFLICGAARVLAVVQLQHFSCCLR